MPFAWRPVPGQVALIEIPGVGHECITGVVVDSAHNDEVVVDLGSSPAPPEKPCEVVVSFFAPDALYRVHAQAQPHDGLSRVVDLSFLDVERVQRRSSPRARMELDVRLRTPDGEPAVEVEGRTFDIGHGGCRVFVTHQFPAGVDPVITMLVPDGNDMEMETAVLQVVPRRGGFEYRLVFLEVGDSDRYRLTQLIRNVKGRDVA